MRYRFNSIIYFLIIQCKHINIHGILIYILCDRMYLQSVVDDYHFEFDLAEK